MSEEALSVKAREALKHIRNWVMQHGKVPSVRELMTAMYYKSSRSALLLIDELAENGFLEKKDGSVRMIKDLNSENMARTVAIPLVGSVACGTPLLAEENVEAMIPISDLLVRRGNRYFLLKASGDSMNEAGISDGDLILVRQQSLANNGDIVVALIDDEATVKEFFRDGEIVMLLPHSTNKRHQPIIVTSELKIQGVVETAIPYSKRRIQ
jgi:repressor LexA